MHIFFNIRSRSKRIAIDHSPLRIVLNEKGLQSKVVRSTTKPAEATPVDEKAEGSSSSGSDCALILRPPKPPKLATTSRKRPTSSAGWKTFAKEKVADIEN